MDRFSILFCASAEALQHLILTGLRNPVMSTVPTHNTTPDVVPDVPDSPFVSYLFAYECSLSLVPPQINFSLTCIKYTVSNSLFPSTAGFFSELLHAVQNILANSTQGCVRICSWLVWKAMIGCWWQASSELLFQCSSNPETLASKFLKIISVHSKEKNNNYAHVS